MRTDYLEQMTIIEEACKKAGEIALSYAFSEKTEISSPIPKDVVTIADQLINQFLYDQLLARNPTYGWFSEESPNKNVVLEKQRFYVVDPIDGTKSFLEKSNEYAISVALIEKNEVVASAVYNPATNQMFTAARGAGVYLNSVHTSRTTKNNYCLVSRNDEKAGIFKHLQNKFILRPINSIAYKLALVGIGEGAWTVSLTPKNLWDIAAGLLICEENGCVVTDLEGKEINFRAESPLINGILALSPASNNKIKLILSYKRSTCMIL